MAIWVLKNIDSIQMNEEKYQKYNQLICTFDPQSS